MYNANKGYTQKEEKYTYSKPNDIAENILQREFFASAPKQK